MQQASFYNITETEFLVPVARLNDDSIFWKWKFIDIYLSIYVVLTKALIVEIHESSISYAYLFFNSKLLRQKSLKSQFKILTKMILYLTDPSTLWLLCDCDRTCSVLDCLPGRLVMFEQIANFWIKLPTEWSWPGLESKHSDDYNIIRDFSIFWAIWILELYDVYKSPVTSVLSVNDQFCY